MEGDTIAIIVGVCTAVLVAALIGIVVGCQKKLQKKEIKQDKVRLEEGHMPKDDTMIRPQSVQGLHSTATQTTMGKKQSVYVMPSSSASGMQHRASPIPSIYAIDYGTGIKLATLDPEAKKEIISDLKKNYPTQPIPTLVVSQSKEDEHEEKYSRNWMTEHTSMSTLHEEGPAQKEDQRHSSLDEEIIKVGEETWNRRMEDILKNVDLSEMALEGNTEIPRPVIYL